MVASPWEATGAGVLRWPSGRLVRGRGLRRPLPPGPEPTLAVYLSSKPPPAVAWQARWVRRPGFWLPRDQAHARDVLHEAWERALAERVEIVCPGGRGRIGTALACLAIIDGLPREQAVAFVRQHYDPHAVETPWQKRYAAHFPAPRRAADPGRQTHGHAADGGDGSGQAAACCGRGGTHSASQSFLGDLL
jgi:hypothetical protein